MSAFTARPGCASGFMTTTAQSPPFGFHVTACCPGPDACTAQIDVRVGATDGAGPLSVRSLLSAYHQLVTTRWLTPARYASTADCGAMPMKTGVFGVTAVARTRTRPRMSPGVLSDALPRSIFWLLMAYDDVAKVCFELVT